MNRLSVIAVLSLLACNGGDDRRPDRPDPTTGDDDDAPTVDTGSTDTGVSDTGTPPLQEMPALDAAVAVIRGSEGFAYSGGFVSLADFTDDGGADLAIMSTDGSGVRVSLFEGPVMGEHTHLDAFDWVPRGSGGAGIADLNGDEVVDLGLMKSGTAVTDEIHLYFGPFDPAERRTGPDAVIVPDPTAHAAGVDFCDADGDDVADAVMAYNHEIRVALGPFGPGLVGDQAISVVFDEDDGVVFDTSPYMLCGHDLTGDGSHDLLLVDDSLPQPVWLLQDPPWSGWQEVVEVGEPMNIINGGGAMDVVGDLTGDGLPDLFIDEGSTGSLLEGPITATSEPFARFEWWEPDASTAPVGDLDGDGNEDLAVGLPGYHPEGAVLLFHGPIGAGTYDDEDADLVLTSDDGEVRLGGNVFTDASSSVWGASAPNSTEDGFANAGRVYLFDGWPSP